MPRRIVRRELARPVPDGLALSPVLARVYAARSVRSADELDYSLARLLPYRDLSGVDAAVALLVEALEAGRRILVVGDFDADGATSCALMMRSLRALGAAHVDYLVPNRFEFGYGLTPEIVGVAAQREPQLIITVDNGISSVAGVAEAARRGIPVLVTDHHLPPDELPAAAAIVNPNLPGDRFASKHLAGVGVAFYLIAALRARLRALDWFDRRGLPEPVLADYLDLVALGTVADVVPLDHNNRILVAQGLQRIRAGRACAGIQAICRVAQRDPARLIAADLGFAIGPRLNAAGRLDDMSQGIECLLADDPGTAARLAATLDELNRERREVEADMQAGAERILAELDPVVDSEGGSRLPASLCLFDPSWHEGVIGILASRVKERVHRPVIGFAPSSLGDGSLKGSGRSIPGLHIRDALEAVATRHPGLVSRFGGHAMAAGLSLAPDHLDAFRAAFDEEVGRRLQGQVLEDVVLSDGELSADQLVLGLAAELRDSGPWGQAFPEPVFDGEFDLLQRRVVGDRHLKMVVRAPGSAQALDAIAFNFSDADWPPAVARIRLAYRLDVNLWRNQRSLQLLVSHCEVIA